MRNIEQACAGRVRVLASGELPPTFKYGEALHRYLQGQPATAPAAAQGLLVGVFEAEAFAALRAVVGTMGVSADSLSPTTLRLSVASAAVAERVATLPFVNFVDFYVPAKAEPEANAAIALHPTRATNGIDVVNYDRKGPIGKDVWFMNWEPYGGMAYFPINAYGRTLPGDLGDNTVVDHGSLTGSVAAGANNVDEWNHGGMAPGMTYLSSVRYSPDASGARKALAGGYAPLVSNQSLKTGEPGYANYTDEAPAFDALTYERRDYLPVFSAGNENKGTYNGYTKPGYGSLTGNVKTSKNGITVHATSHPGVSADFASFGPTKDGRMKPDIAAEGTAGTSIAAPGVAGLAGVLTEELKTVFQTTRMDAVKAVMLNTALRTRTFKDPVTKVKTTDHVNHITYRSGFGQINALAAVEAVRECRLAFGEKIAQGGVKEFAVDVPAGQTELRFLLYYHDVAGQPNAAKALINDLDLEVVTPTNETILPWTLDPSPEKVDQPPVRKVNRLDNVEQVVLTAATKDAPLVAGRYTVRVRGHLVPNPAQQPDYVVTWQYRPRGLRLLTLPEGMRLRGGLTYLSWELTLPEDENTLIGDKVQKTLYPRVSYQYGDGAWMKATTTDYGANYAQIVLPRNTALSADAKFRIQLGNGLETVSGKTHLFESFNTAPKIVELTPQSVKLQVTASSVPFVHLRKTYVHALNKDYMTEIGSVQGGVSTLTMAAPAGMTFTADTWFAVSYEYNGVKSQRTLPASFDPQNELSSMSQYGWQALTHSLCGEDSVQLPTLPTAGNVQWYKLENGTPVALPAEKGGNARNSTFRVADRGQYYYTLTAGTPAVQFYQSPVVTISSTIPFEDKDRWGKDAWVSTVYYDAAANAASETIYRDGLPMYGGFEVRKLGFDFNEDLLKSGVTYLPAITSYKGCNPPGDATQRVFVMRRTGFEPGNYTFRVRRATGRVRILVRSGDGAEVKNVYQANVTDGTAFTVALEEKSLCEIQWTGAQLELDIASPAAFTAVKPGHYYRFTNAMADFHLSQGYTKSLSLDYATRRLKWENSDSRTAAQLFCLTPRGTATPDVAIRTANTDEYFASVSSPLSASPQTMTLEPVASAEGAYHLRFGTEYYNAYNHLQGGGFTGSINNQKSLHPLSSGWIVEEVLSIDVAISSAGYATGHYPFALRVPADTTVKVYRPLSVTADGDWLKLQRLAPGTSLPARTPFIVQGAEGKHRFAIDYDNAVTGSATGVLLGTTAPENISSQALILGYTAEKGVGLYPVKNENGVSTTQLGENKAYYLPPAGVPARTFVGLQTDDLPTGVSAPLAPATKAPQRYTLDGRRATTEKGVLITSDGKKVLYLEGARKE